MSILYVKNADSSLTPLLYCRSGENNLLDVSLVHQHQNRAQIRLFQLPEDLGFRNLERGETAAALECGMLDIKNLPENPFGELRIRMKAEMLDDRHVQIITWLGDDLLQQCQFKVAQLKSETPPRGSRHGKGDGIPGVKARAVPAKSEKTARPAKNAKTRKPGFLLRFAALFFTCISVAELALSLVLWLTR